MRTVIPFLALVACTSGRDAHEPSALLGVDETAEWAIPGLTAPVQVIRTEGNVPHVYAADETDLARVEGFVMAQDRFFMMDLARRLSQGRISELLGDIALDSDIESRSNGTKYVAENVLATMPPERLAEVQAFCDGVNAYIEAVRNNQLPPPSEYEIAAPLLGAASPVDVMEPFEPIDVAAIGATLIYNLGYETGDVGNQSTADQVPGHFVDVPFADLRQAGLETDIWAAQEPPVAVQQAPDRSRRRPIPDSLAERLTERLDAWQAARGRDHEMGWGSNAWAVSGAHSTDGRALVAGDGHLPLSMPSLFWQIGRDTSVLGGGDTHQMGLAFPGMPPMAVGTNGEVAWSQTQLMGDITDWYREELTLDDAGRPLSTLFQGAQQPLVAVDETYIVANVPILGSEGRTEVWTRWTTFDGRWISDIEGRSTSQDETLGEGETLVNLGGRFVVPGDTDGDGIVTAISFDYTGFDRGNLVDAVDRLGHAHSVEDFDNATKWLDAYSQNMVVGDSTGSILYTGWQPVPCRNYLERDGDGRWTEGSDPSKLLDGTKYGAFTIPFSADGSVDFAPGAADPYQCVVPFDVYPRSIDPEQGYLASANNDPGGWSLDGALYDDEWYIGGPWIEGYRAQRISDRLASSISAGTADLDEMQSIQADTRSSLGAQFAPELLRGIENAQAVAELSRERTPDEQRLVDLYLANADAYDDVAERIAAWSANDFPTPSGVETFYHTGADAEHDDSVATTLFNAWFGHWVRRLFDDEGFPDVFRNPTGGTARTRLLTKMIGGRGPDNPLGLLSWNPATEESVYFDVLSTDEIERSDEMALIGLQDALAFLQTAPQDGRGGYGTDDLDEYVWGYRHYVHFDSLLGDYIDSDSGFEAIVTQFAITPNDLPLAEGMAGDDPRREIPGFPRDGDNFSVDAANAGMNGEYFEYGSGPVFRIVVALGPDGVEGRNIMPGGQSGLLDSPYRTDQAALWLGNQTWPMRITVDEVVGGAIGRESFLPADPPLEDN